MYYKLIRNAHILDPGCNRDEMGDLLIGGTKILPYSGGELPDSCQVIDAGGTLVLPGLIDFHTHIAYGLGDTGIHPDLMTIPNGITAAVDAGSTGTAAFEGLVRYVMANNETTIRAFLHVAAIGVTTEVHSEQADPSLYDVERIRMLVERYYPSVLLGLKVRVGRGFTTGWGAEPLKRAKELARQLGCPLCVHLTDSEFPYEEALNLLEAGDILCHCFQNRGRYSILDAQGQVLQAARAAREKGVLFDMAAGRINYDLQVLKQAAAQGFWPDIISTDTVASSVYEHKLFGLPYVMSYALDAGIPLMEVLRACTATPAAQMGLAGTIGMLQPGADADIAIFQLAQHPITFCDQAGHRLEGEHLFVPLATFKQGRAVYKRIEFEFWGQPHLSGVGATVCS